MASFRHPQRFQRRLEIRVRRLAADDRGRATRGFQAGDIRAGVEFESSRRLPIHIAVHAHQSGPSVQSPEDAVHGGVTEVVTGATDRDDVGITRLFDQFHALEITAPSPSDNTKTRASG